MSNMEDFEITDKQRFAGNITAGAVVVLCGLFLLLCGLNVIPLSVPKILLGSLLLSVGLVLLCTGLIQKNTVSIWLAFAFLTPAAVEFSAKFTSAGYGTLYPMYIAIPAVSSFFTMLYSREWKSHIFIILLFGVTAFLFSLNSSGLLGWSVVLPIIIVFAGLAIILYTIKLFKDPEEGRGNE